MTAPHASAALIWFVTLENWADVQASIGPTATRFALSCGFEPKPGKSQILPDPDGAILGVLFGDSASDGDPLAAGKLAASLPAGDYRFANAPRRPELAALGFLMGLYRFDRFKAQSSRQPRLVAEDSAILTEAERIAAAAAFGRDLINRPANDLTPSALEAAAADLARAHGAAISTIVGDELLTHNFPLIHAVGSAASEPPRLIDFTWGRADAPKVTLVGKGVVFDTGGLDIKPANGMELMKKDMGGAATALTLARLIMEAGLDLRLRVIAPIVENAISAAAMRPGDIVKSRKGLTVEIGNTDAEGRLILADALVLAAEEAPELLFDFATLTGAARVALGPDLPPFFTDDEALAADIAGFCASAADPVWRLPLWRPYDSMLDSPVADLNNAPGSPFAGSITAALFLRRFVAGAKSWAHFDVYGWNPKARAHGPQGGEVQAARGLFNLLKVRFPAL